MGQEIILPDLVLPSRAHQRWQYSGIDSLEKCLDKRHFRNYPHSVEYVYNSRGFRDSEWPDSLDELRAAIWCIGDSFTVGVGQPFNHVWPRVLSEAANRRTINISMDGASNDWIFRRASDIKRYINPIRMVVMWSYTHRRESDETYLSDELRRIANSKNSTSEDYAHWISVSNRLHIADPQIIQITIPDFHPTFENPEDLWSAIKDKDWPTCPKNISELQQMPTFILEEITALHKCYAELEKILMDTSMISNLLADVIFMSQRLDWARDHHHFDILTSRWVVDRILRRLVA